MTTTKFIAYFATAAIIASFAVWTIAPAPTEGRSALDADWRIRPPSPDSEATLLKIA
jgi:hypothetical protein